MTSISKYIKPVEPQQRYRTGTISDIKLLGAKTGFTVSLKSRYSREKDLVINRINALRGYIDDTTSENHKM